MSIQEALKPAAPTPETGVNDAALSPEEFTQLFRRYTEHGESRYNPNASYIPTIAEFREMEALAGSVINKPEFLPHRWDETPETKDVYYGPTGRLTDEQARFIPQLKWLADARAWVRDSADERLLAEGTKAWDEEMRNPADSTKNGPLLEAVFLRTDGLDVKGSGELHRLVDLSHESRRQLESQGVDVDELLRTQRDQEQPFTGQVRTVHRLPPEVTVTSPANSARVYDAKGRVVSGMPLKHGLLRGFLRKLPAVELPQKVSATALLPEAAYGRPEALGKDNGLVLGNMLQDSRFTPDESIVASGLYPEKMARFSTVHNKGRGKDVYGGLDLLDRTERGRVALLTRQLRALQGFENSIAQGDAVPSRALLAEAFYGHKEPTQSENWALTIALARLNREVARRQALQENQAAKIDRFASLRYARDDTTKWVSQAQAGAVQELKRARDDIKELVNKTVPPEKRAAAMQWLYQTRDQMKTFAERVSPKAARMVQTAGHTALSLVLAMGLAPTRSGNIPETGLKKATVATTEYRGNEERKASKVA